MDHYFSATPESDRTEISVTLKLASGDTVELVSDRGVFSSQRVDPGTQVLLHEAPVPSPNSRVLDLGCGYGPIAVWCAGAEPTCEVTAVDINERALELCATNAKQLSLNNLTVVAPDEVAEETQFDFIYSNPPARTGKEDLHAMLLRWMTHLKPDGTAYLVVQKHLGSDSLASWLTHEGYPTEKIASKRAYRVLRTRKASD